MTGPLRARLRLVRNGTDCFLLGASWQHHQAFPQRRTHVYLGPWLLTYTHASDRRAEQ